MGDVRYDVDALLERARGAAKLSDFGSDDFVAPLRVLCETYARAPFDEQGHKRNQRRLLTLLATVCGCRPLSRATPRSKNAGSHIRCF